jgi:hypothetical protein
MNFCIDFSVCEQETIAESYGAFIEIEEIICKERDIVNVIEQVFLVQKPLFVDETHYFARLYVLENWRSEPRGIYLFEYVF